MKNASIWWLNRLDPILLWGIIMQVLINLHQYKKALASFAKKNWNGKRFSFLSMRILWNRFDQLVWIPSILSSKSIDK